MCHATKIAQECQGCDGYESDPTSAYQITDHDGNVTDPVWYCDECACLAACDWNGETAKIDPSPKYLPRTAYARQMAADRAA